MGQFAYEGLGSVGWVFLCEAIARRCGSIRKDIHIELALDTKRYAKQWYEEGVLTGECIETLKEASELFTAFALAIETRLANLA